MKLRVPIALTADNSENYDVSIRLWSGGLSFSGCRISDRDDFFSGDVVFGNDISVVQSIKDIYFDNQCFSYSYNKLYVTCVSDRYTLVPDVIYSEKDKELLFSYCHKDDKGLKIIVQHIEKLNSWLLFGIDLKAYEFLVRSLVNPSFIHALSPLLILWQEKSFQDYPKQMYVVINDGFFDILCFERGDILFVNSFRFETDNDILYFILYVCKQLGFNQLDDVIHFVGDKLKCNSVMSVVKDYIGRLDCFDAKSLNQKMPLDVNPGIDTVALLKCGL
ncbi:MAG: DUF3822 family protein [Tannerella sp.]|jgi:hypothetical protein|nr:DUF3822 family protein [Tannerella sp.]